MHVVVVHYKSGGMLHELVQDLAVQQGVNLAVHVVECGDDGSVAGALGEIPIAITSPGENLGYCGGNNLKLRELLKADAPICLINPDVRVPSATTMAELHGALMRHPELAAIAPSIRTPEDRIEYTGSVIDLPHACAVHTGTNVAAWPSGAPEVVRMAWIDGACWMLRPQALREVGLLDERFFLFSDEVDWCLRASRLEWQLGVLRDAEVHHQRSSSFGDSTKGAYYAWRNTFLLCRIHKGYGTWIPFWLRRLLAFVISRENLRAGQSWAALRGARDAVLGRTGRMRGDV